MRYQVTGVPAGVQLTAIMPHLNRLAGSGAQQYKPTVQGHPGTLGVPAPTGDSVPSPDLGDLAQTGFHRSADAPQAWYPNQYYDASLNGGGAMGPVTPVRIYSDNMLPVPAKDARGRGQVLARPITQSSLFQVAAPRVIPAWGPGG
jgi:hypothetical protein